MDDAFFLSKKPFAREKPCGFSVSFPVGRALASETPSPALKADGHIILRLEKYSTWKIRQKEISGINTFPAPRLGAVSDYVLLCCFIPFRRAEPFR